MKRSGGHRGALVILLLASVLGGILRYLQLTIVFDSEGLPTTGHPLTWGLSLFSVAVVVLCGVFCLRLPERRTSQAVYRVSALDLGVSVAAGFLLLLAGLMEVADSLMSLHSSSQQMLVALCVLAGAFGVVAALCVLAAAAQRYHKKKPSSALYIVPFLYLMCELVLNFKSWSSDPIILDYCFKLFALIFAMSGAYRIGGFCFDQGRRRLSAFWAMGGVYFCAVSLPGGSLSEIVLFCALGLWLLDCVGLTLGAGKDPAPAPAQEDTQSSEKAEEA